MARKLTTEHVSIVQEEWTKAFAVTEKGDAMPTFNSVFFDIGDTLVTAGAWVEGAKATLRQLKSSGVRLGLISNTGDFSRDELQHLLPSDFSFGDFEDALIILSKEVDLEKPDLPIFLLAVQRAGVPPWQCLFVGENLRETIAAQAAGMRAARIVRVPDDLLTLPQIGT